MTTSFSGGCACGAIRYVCSRAPIAMTHSGWEKLSDNAQQARDSYNHGWERVFVTAYPGYIRNRAQVQGR